MTSDPSVLEQDQQPPDAPPPGSPRKRSAARRKMSRQAVEQQIDAFMVTVGYASPSERTDGHGWRWFEFGSAKGRVGVVQSDSDGELFFRAESLVTELPSEGDELLPLLRELLEANMTIAGSPRLGISGEGVFVCATIPLAELAADGVAANIHSVMSLADRFAGGPSRPDSEPEEAAESGQQVDGRPEFTLAA